MKKFFLLIVIAVLASGCEVTIFDWDDPDPTTILIYNDSVKHEIVVYIEHYNPLTDEYEKKESFRLGTWDKAERIWPLGEEYRLRACYDIEFEAGKYRYWSRDYIVIVDDLTEKFFKDSNLYGEIIVFDPEQFRYIEEIQLYVDP